LWVAIGNSQNAGSSSESGIYPHISGYIPFAIQCERKTMNSSGMLISSSGSSWEESRECGFAASKMPLLTKRCFMRIIILKPLVAMPLLDTCKTQRLDCKITSGNSQPKVRSWLMDQPIRFHFYALSSALTPFCLQPAFLLVSNKCTFIFLQ